MSSPTTSKVFRIADDGWLTLLVVEPHRLEVWHEWGSGFVLDRTYPVSDSIRRQLLDSATLPSAEIVADLEESRRRWREREEEDRASRRRAGRRRG